MLRAYINDKALADIKYMALFRSETNWLNICPHAICGYMANLTDCGRGEGGGSLSKGRGGNAEQKNFNCWFEALNPKS